MDATHKPKAEVVALFHRNDDTLNVLRLGLERAGFIAVTGHVHDIRTGALEFGAFIEEHQPKVIVYDLVTPYDRNWAFMKHVREHAAMRGRQFVISTPNLPRAREAVGRDERVHEVVADDDIDAIILAVREALKARPTR